MENDINADALKSEIRLALINQKANACPMAIRLAWHASGTFNVSDKTGGSNGATMRFDPESLDPANSGLSIIQDLLLPIKQRHPEVSYSDLWTLAGCAAIEFLGGPQIPFRFGRMDAPNNSTCPAHGRLPDANLGGDHLREIFYRMGFNDQEIVCLAGAHTLGSCHRHRSGFEGPWTRNPLKFDNTYYKNLLHLEWTPRKWEGPLQYADSLTGELMMLPSDLALIEDPEFRKYVEIYAADEQRFFDDFSRVFSKLITLGCPVQCDPFQIGTKKKRTEKEQASIDFREASMHGRLDVVMQVAPKADVHEIERSSGRTALHKAAFWGQLQVATFLLNDCKLNPNVQDFNGDTALHDASRFGHISVVHLLLKHGADPSIRNNERKTAQDVASQYGKEDVADLLTKHPSNL